MRTLWVVLVLAFLGLQYKLWLGDGNIYQWLSLEHKNIAQEDINKKLRSRNIALTAEIQDLKLRQINRVIHFWLSLGVLVQRFQRALYFCQ